MPEFRAIVTDHGMHVSYSDLGSAPDTGESRGSIRVGAALSLELEATGPIPKEAAILRDGDEVTVVVGDDESRLRALFMAGWNAGREYERGRDPEPGVPDDGYGEDAAFDRQWTEALRRHSQR